MARYNYQRLSAQDNSFLIGETRTRLMHLVLVYVFESGSLRTAEGGIDFRRARADFEEELDRVPRYRQKLKRVPLTGRPVWIDDHEFNLDYHLHHISLPRQGGIEQLRALAAWINGQQLDRDRPLWEAWFVEGLEAGRFAVITKLHHCMADGKSVVDLMGVLFSSDPKRSEPDLHPPYAPKPVPAV